MVMYTSSKAYSLQVLGFTLSGWKTCSIVLQLVRLPDLSEGNTSSSVYLRLNSDSFRRFTSVYAAK